MGMYQSGWSPRGIKKDWERCSMDAKNAGEFVGAHPLCKGVAEDAVAWFDDDGSCRVLVIDFDSGRRVDFRFLAKSTKATSSLLPK